MALNESQKIERSEYLEKNLQITECSQRKPYVFISYASDDWERVFKSAVVPMQKQYGLRTYADKAFDKVNDKWIVPMLRNVRGADVIVAFISQSYIESYACFLEFLTAVNSKRPIVFVSLTEQLRLGDTTDQPNIESGVKDEILKQGENIATNTNNTSNDLMRAAKSAYTSIATLLNQDALSKYDISDAFINFFRDASINRKTINDLNAVRGTIHSLSNSVFDLSLITEPTPAAVSTARGSAPVSTARGGAPASPAAPAYQQPVQQAAPAYQPPVQQVQPSKPSKPQAAQQAAAQADAPAQQAWASYQRPVQASAQPQAQKQAQPFVPKAPQQAPMAYQPLKPQAAPTSQQPNKPQAAPAYQQPNKPQTAPASQQQSVSRPPMVDTAGVSKSARKEASPFKENLPLILGIVSFLLLFAASPISIIAGIAGIVLGVKALNTEKRKAAIAALVLSGLALLVWVIAFIAVL